MEKVYLILTSKRKICDVGGKRLNDIVKLFKEINVAYEVYEEVEINGKVDLIKVEI